MKLQLLRNATQILEVNSKKILVDPMLAPQGTYDAFPFTGNDTRNPTTGLPLNETEIKQLLDEIDAVLLTHLHLDHWDITAQQALAKNTPVICQPWDVPAIEQAGFTHILPVTGTLLWHNIKINRTGGRHGTGEIGERMGRVSGYVIQFDNKTLYIAGDTIWCAEVEQAMDTYRPNYIVVNGGGARFVSGDAIVMNIDDVTKVCRHAPQAKVCVVHLEAVNHSKESRELIRDILNRNGFAAQTKVPDNGEIYLM